MNIAVSSHLYWSWFVTWHWKIRTLAYPHLKILDSSYKTEWKKVTISKNVFKLPKTENFQQQADPIHSNKNVKISISILDNNFILSVESYSRDKALRVKTTSGAREKSSYSDNLRYRSMQKQSQGFCQQPVFTGYKAHTLVSCDAKHHTSLLLNWKGAQLSAQHTHQKPSTSYVTINCVDSGPVFF